MNIKRFDVRRLLLTGVSLLTLLTQVVSPSPVLANTPDPATVTIAGSLQSEVGCAGDWDPACSATYLTYDAGDDIWQGTFALPAGSYEYKAALNNGWTENYGANAGFISSCCVINR